MPSPTFNNPSPIEYHVLLALASQPLYGYAVKTAIEEESSGALKPLPGSLYRLIARMIRAGLVEETPTPPKAEPHPGLARKYYGLTTEGQRVLHEETSRICTVAALASKRLNGKRLSGESGD